jgi:hypothetical protein
LRAAERTDAPVAARAAEALPRLHSLAEVLAQASGRRR